MLIGVSLLLLLGWGIIRFYSGKTESYRAYSVTPIESASIIQERGILQSTFSILVSTKVRGTIEALAEEGQIIKPGDLLLSMDSEETLNRIEREELSLAEERIELQRLEAQLAFEAYREEVKTELLKRKAEHAQLHKEYEFAKPDDTAQRLLEISHQLALFDLEEAESNLKRQENLFEKGFLAESALDPYRRRVESAKAYLQEIEITDKVRRKGISEELRIELTRKVERANANLDRHASRTERRLNNLRFQVEVAQKRIEKTKYELNVLQESLKQANVRAEDEGVFILNEYRDWGSGGRRVKLQPGIQRWPQDVVGEIIDPSKMKVRLAIHEADIGKLTEGMRAEVNVYAFPGKTFEGRLSLLSLVGRDRSDADPLGQSGSLSNVVVYNAEVDFEGQGVDFRPGMSALVSFIAKEKKARLLIPREALQWDEGKPQVLRQTLFGAEEMAVEGAVFDAFYFEVTAGISEGDTLLIPERGKGSE